MIQVQELRIGNILNRENTGHSIEITAEHIYHWDKFKDVLFGMALTPEILEKAGFIKDPKGGYEYFDILLSGVRKTKLRGFMIENRLCTVFKNERFVDLQYLHQLQNLYFTISGKELEIIL